ncbi:MAG: hypothetical protein GXP01_07895 [Alphaproteobacteria bacterium]|nr:hypothetical protein [Alphaproteobacteria bacterium]
MSSFINLLIWAHLIGLAMAVGSGMALSQVGPRIAKGDEKQREALWDVYGALIRLVHGGLGVLLITGPLIVWLRYEGFSGLDMWFSIKMALVVILLISVLVGTRAGKKLRGGDMSARNTTQRAGMLNGILGILIVLTAAFSFNA